MDTWNFRWDTIELDGLFARRETGWMLQGRNFVSPGTGWAIAHDVFHHAPNDTGSFAEEVASFGAQTWFESGPGLQSKLGTSKETGMLTTPRPREGCILAGRKA